VVTLTPPEVVTFTSTVPVPGGDAAVHEEAEQETCVAAVDPKVTVPPLRLLPVTVTTVPPGAGPDVGAIPVTTGAGGGGGDVA
jgi:hypothetical protein